MTPARSEEAVTADEISLTLPAEDAFHGVAHLVLGGLAVRLDLTFETLEDLELGLDAVLRRISGGGDVTVAVRVQPDELVTRVGPIGDGLREQLEAQVEQELGVRRILETVVDRVEFSSDGRWLELGKSV
jgi:hypothetical protein